MISGEITQAKNILFAAIQRSLDSHALPAFVKNTPLVASELKNEDVIGAFALIKRALLDGACYVVCWQTKVRLLLQRFVQTVCERVKNFIFIKKRVDEWGRYQHN